MSNVVQGQAQPPEGPPDPELERMGAPLSLRDYLREIWERRDFLVSVSLGELRAQHKNTVLGNLWHLLDPLLLAGVFLIVFGVILNLDRGVDNYPLFLATGVLTFYFIRKSLMSGSATVIRNVKLIQNIRVPRVVLPVSVIMTETLAHFPVLVVLVGIALATGEPVTLAWLLLVPVLLVQALFNLGLGFFAARLTFHFLDTARIIPSATRLWLYLSGIFYTIDFVPQGWPRTLFQWNPAHAFISLNRAALLDGSTLAISWLVGLVWAVALAVLGFFFFRSREQEYGRG